MDKNKYLNKIKKWNEQNKTWFWGGIGGVIIMLIATVAITIYSNSDKKNHTSMIDNSAIIKISDNQSEGVSIDGNVVVTGDSAITGNGDIHINKLS